LGAHGIVAGAHQIADGSSVSSGTTDQREIPEPRQTGQHHGVAPVGLDAITGRIWESVRGHHFNRHPFALTVSIQQ